MQEGKGAEIDGMSVLTQDVWKSLRDLRESLFVAQEAAWQASEATQPAGRKRCDERAKEAVASALRKCQEHKLCVQALVAMCSLPAGPVPQPPADQGAEELDMPEALFRGLGVPEVLAAGRERAGNTLQAQEEEDMERRMRSEVMEVTDTGGVMAGLRENFAHGVEDRARAVGELDSWEEQDTARNERWFALDRQTDALNKLLAKARAQMANLGGVGVGESAPAMGANDSFASAARSSLVVTASAQGPARDTFGEVVAAGVEAKVPTARWGNQFEVDRGIDVWLHGEGAQAPCDHQQGDVPQAAVHPHLHYPPFVDDFEDDEFCPPSSSSYNLELSRRPHSAGAPDPLEQVLADSQPTHSANADAPTAKSGAPQAGGVMLIQQPIRAGRLQGAALQASQPQFLPRSVVAEAAPQAGATGGYSYPGLPDSQPSPSASRSSLRGSAGPAAPFLLPSTSSSASSTASSPSPSPRFWPHSQRVVLVSSSSPGIIQTGNMRTPVIWHHK